jgi:hypothetical protein
LKCGKNWKGYLAKIYFTQRNFIIYKLSRIIELYDRYMCPDHKKIKWLAYANYP